ncbi:YrhB domain-containing protein [Streptomyces sp. NPDC048516]|uniref:YrhB domain-containing protein n=1 Tax=Streptomyces sp. NPDC048516 TaxID=3365565 RepID=UPI00371B1B89
MTEREAAVHLVEEELDREHQKWSALGVDPVRTAVLHVAEHELVWKVYWQSEEYARTRNPSAMLIGHGPYLVDRIDGGLHQIGALAESSGKWEADYRARIRGMGVPTAVDDLHDELRETAATRGRVQAVRALRQRLAMLSPGQALDYVNALLGGEAPPGLVALAVGELVPPSTRYSPCGPSAGEDFTAPPDSRNCLTPAADFSPGKAGEARPAGALRLRGPEGHRRRGPGGVSGGDGGDGVETVGTGVAPLPLPLVTIGMAWHPRHAADGAHHWLSDAVRRTLHAPGSRAT